MKIPQSVKVGAMTYDVVVVPNMLAERSLFGEVDVANQTIKIAGDISPERQFNALMHELYHAIRFEAGDVGDHGEQEIRAVSNMLTQVFVDNGLNFGGGTDE